MDGWLRVTDAIKAIEALGRSETIEAAEPLKREAVLAVSRMQHSSSEVVTSLKEFEDSPIEIVTTQTRETGRPFQYDRYSSFSGTGEPATDQLWQVYTVVNRTDFLGGRFV